MKYKLLNEFENSLACIAIVIMLVILMVQVVGRYCFGYAPTWIEEAARYLFVWTTYAAACNGVFHNTHLKIDAALKLFPKIIRPYIQYVGNLIFFVYAIAVGVFGVEYCQGIFKAQQISASLHVKMGYIYLVLPIFHFLMAIRIVQLTITMLRHPEQFTPEATLQAQIESEAGKAEKE